MLIPGDISGKGNGVGEGKYLAARRKLLREAEQRTNCAERVSRWIILNVILPRQSILGVHHVIHTGDSLVHVCLRARPLYHGIISEGGGLGRIRDLSTWNQILIVGKLGIQEVHRRSTDLTRLKTRIGRSLIRTASGKKRSCCNRIGDALCAAIVGQT